MRDIAAERAQLLEEMNDVTQSGEVVYIDSSESTEGVELISSSIKAGPGTKVIDRATGTVLVDGTQTSTVHVEIKGD